MFLAYMTRTCQYTVSPHSHRWQPSYSRLAQRVQVSGSVFGIISILSFFTLSFVISPTNKARIKLETCSCAQNVRLEILFPAVIKFLSFHCGKLVKIRSKACYPNPISQFFLNCKIGYRIIPIQRTVRSQNYNFSLATSIALSIRAHPPAISVINYHYFNFQ